MIGSDICSSCFSFTNGMQLKVSLRVLSRCAETFLVLNSESVFVGNSLSQLLLISVLNCRHAAAGRPPEIPAGNHGQSLPIPVPTQLQNYQRMEQNLRQDGSPRSASTHTHTLSGGRLVLTRLHVAAVTHGLSVSRLATPVRRCSSGSLLGFARTGPSPPYCQGAAAANRRLSLGGARPFQLSPPGTDVVMQQQHPSVCTCLM